MPFIMKKYEALDPVNVALFSFGTVLPRAERLANLVEQLRVRSRWRRRSVSFEIQPAVDHRERAPCGPVRVDVIYHNYSPCHFAYRSAPSEERRQPSGDFVEAFTAVDAMTGRNSRA